MKTHGEDTPASIFYHEYHKLWRTVATGLVRVVGGDIGWLDVYPDRFKFFKRSSRAIASEEDSFKMQMSPEDGARKKCYFL